MFRIESHMSKVLLDERIMVGNYGQLPQYLLQLRHSPNRGFRFWSRDRNTLSVRVLPLILLYESSSK